MSLGHWFDEIDSVLSAYRDLWQGNPFADPEKFSHQLSPVQRQTLDDIPFPLIDQLQSNDEALLTCLSPVFPAAASLQKLSDVLLRQNLAWPTSEFAVRKNTGICTRKETGTNSLFC